MGDISQDLDELNAADLQVIDDMNARDDASQAVDDARAAVDAARAAVDALIQNEGTAAEIDDALKDYYAAVAALREARARLDAAEAALRRAEEKRDRILEDLSKDILESVSAN
jgi:hypothetical protein